MIFLSGHMSIAQLQLAKSFDSYYRWYRRHANHASHANHANHNSHTSHTNEITSLASIGRKTGKPGVFQIQSRTIRYHLTAFMLMNGGLQVAGALRN
jgi:hypothetical protein